MVQYSANEGILLINSVEAKIQLSLINNFLQRQISVLARLFQVFFLVSSLSSSENVIFNFVRKLFFK